MYSITIRDPGGLGQAWQYRRYAQRYTRPTQDRYITTYQQGRRVRVRLGPKRPDPVYIKGPTYRPVTRRQVTRQPARRPATRPARSWWVERNIRLQQDVARKAAARRKRQAEIAARPPTPRPIPRTVAKLTKPVITRQVSPTPAHVPAPREEIVPPQPPSVPQHSITPELQRPTVSVPGLVVKTPALTRPLPTL
jgi:hypothetical protein